MYMSEVLPAPVDLRYPERRKSSPSIALTIKKSYPTIEREEFIGFCSGRPQQPLIDPEVWWILPRYLNNKNFTKP